MAKPLLTEPEMRKALDHCLPEDRPLLVWLVTGEELPSKSTLNGTA